MIVHESQHLKNNLNPEQAKKWREQLDPDYKNELERRAIEEQNKWTEHKELSKRNAYGIQKGVWPTKE
jgi:hypothetical protein